MRNYFFYFGLLIFVSGCYQTTASSLLEPAITVGTSGNIYQASLSYSSNVIIKETTGKTTSQHILNILTSEKYKNTKKIILNTKKKFDHSLIDIDDHSLIDIEKKSNDFYTSVKNLYLKEKN